MGLALGKWRVAFMDKLAKPVRGKIDSYIHIQTYYKYRKTKHCMYFTLD